jgi:hypothetical protein
MAYDTTNQEQTKLRRRDGWRLGLAALENAIAAGLMVH